MDIKMVHSFVLSAVHQMLQHFFSEKFLFLRLCFRKALESIQQGTQLHAFLVHGNLVILSSLSHNAPQYFDNIDMHNMGELHAGMQS